jgi:predicted nucleotidyltransferase
MRINKKWIVLEGYRGSQAHGTYIPHLEPNSIDDIDTMGIFIPSIDYYLGLKQIETIEEKEGVYDRVYYEIKKFFRLLIKGNPNVVGLLWLRPEDYIYKNEIGNLLIKKRNLFVSKKAFYSFAGYANSQMKRIEHFSFNGYMGEKRKSLVMKFGYDCKNASHLIRLLNMCIDFLKTGEYIVFRPEREMLKEIKTGEWPLERVKKLADELFYIAESEFKKSTLPESVNEMEVEKFLIDILKGELL